MSILRRSKAPLSETAWAEIDEQARRCFEATLSVRRFSDVEGPHGLDYVAAPSGRLEVPSAQPQTGARYGIAQLHPLVEVRVPFELSLWELDNLSRGAKDIDLAPLETAAWETARFEETAVYNGLQNGGIKALTETSKHKPVSLGKDRANLIPAVASAVTQLRKSMVEGPYAMVVTEEDWQHLLSAVSGLPLKHHVEYILSGPVVFSPFVERSMLASIRGGDFELILGQDLSVGYEDHTSDSVKLFFTESFTFRTLDPNALIFFE